MNLQRIVLILFTFILSSSFQYLYAQATMLDDPEMQTVISSGLDYMYNMEFEKAESKFKRVGEKYPNHPAYELLKYMSLTWEVSYNNSFKQKAPEGLAYLESALKKADYMLKKDPNDPEGIFFTLAGRASIALYYSQINETLKSVNEARKAYALIKKADQWKEKLIDFNFPVGLYNYYVEQYPENHPVFKPFMFFFYKGNKLQGLKLLDKCSREGIFSKTESTNYISHIYLRYEENYAQTLLYTQGLIKKYPNNLYFKINHCEALIGNKQYKDAEYIAYALYKSDQLLAQIAASTYYGLLNEKHFNNPEKAKAFFNQAISYAQKSEFPIQDFTGQCYAGLGRYYHSKGELKNAIDAYKQCLKVTDYLSLQKEAKQYLNSNDK
jgi:tetratricopeptide (TPR) repeat protein